MVAVQAKTIAAMLIALGAVAVHRRAAEVRAEERQLKRTAADNLEKRSRHCKDFRTQNWRA